MRIILQTIPHDKQRYDTVGDWQTAALVKLPLAGDNERESAQITILADVISVSKMEDWRSNALVAVHELIEAMLCRHAGITQEQVDQWDMVDSHGEPEPGVHPHCPYFMEHKRAEIVEMILANWLGLDWREHEQNVDSVGGDELCTELPSLSTLKPAG